MKKIILMSTLVFVSVILGGCGTTAVRTPAEPASKTAPVQPADSQIPAKTNESANVNIENFAFNPSALTVKSGATVTWTNSDSAPHQIKSDTFNSPVLAKGQSYSFTFQTAGAFNYICSIHPTMAGTINVQ